MLNIKWIRENPELLDKALARRGIDPMSSKILSLDAKHRSITTHIQQLQYERNERSKAISLIRDKSSDEFRDARNSVEAINKQLEELSRDTKSASELEYLLERLPNIPSDDIPDGFSEKDAHLIKSVGNPIYNENDKNHEDLGTLLGLMDFDQTAKISGSRFVTLKSGLARMERALINMMLDINTQEFDYTEISPPCLTRESAMYNVGQLPKFDQESFLTTTGYRLIPTGEVPLVNMVADSIIPMEQLPLRLTAYTPCFRSEAGSAGKDTKGMIRMHQFGKVEVVSITTPDESKNEHEYILSIGERILSKLELPYRVITLASGDMGFAAQKTYDIEVWLPGQRAYREISSCSNCGDFQARRMKARYKEFGSTDTTFVHTLNGSALPIGRTLIAIMENYQNPDGSITVPEALRSYMGNISKIHHQIP